jgi:DNA-directed RNA polymerase subunit M/transcription elongation factor TFIIS
MYYLKITDEDGNIGDTLIYYCRNCGHEDTTLNTTNICVSDMQLLTSEKKYTHIVNEYTKFDPTLPRINTIKCPNQECSSNGFAGGVGKTAEEKALKASMKAEEKAMKTAMKLEEKAAKTAMKAASKAATSKAATSKAATSKAAASKKDTKKKTGLEQVLEEQEELQEEQQAEQQAQAQQEQNEASGENNREVIYIRYDDTNMKYVYLCVHCDTTWRTDNRL